MSAQETPRGLASYKLRFFDHHVRAVPTHDPDGCPFEGPGVDLRGEAATAVLALAAPLRAWLEAREPGIALRSLSVDLAKQRVLVTLDQPGDRPRVLRFDPPSSTDLLANAGPLETAITIACRIALTRRRDR